MKNEQQQIENTQPAPVPQRSKHTIFQLAKIARRIPRARNRALAQLRKKGGTSAHNAYWRNRLYQTAVVSESLLAEIGIRNILGKTFKDAVGPQQRRIRDFKKMLAEANSTLVEDAKDVFRRVGGLVGILGQQTGIKPVS